MAHRIVSVDSLKPGDTVLAPDVGGSLAPGERQIRTIRDEGDIVALRRLGLDDVTLVVSDPQARKAAYEAAIEPETVPDGTAVYTESVGVVRTVMKDVASGRGVDVNAIRKLANRLTRVIDGHPNLMASVAKLRKYDEYTYQHSLNVAVFAASLAKEMDLPESYVHQAALGGLLHDFGKIFVDQDILNKPGKLTEWEFDAMKAHVELGVDYLRQYGFDDSVLALPMMHHERADGTGYPRGLKDHEISTLGKIGAVVDVFDALTSDRCYKKAMPPVDALKMMFGWSDKHFSRSVFQFFVKNIGVYPVGTPVLLSTNELAVVARHNQTKLMQPIVIVYGTTSGRLTSPMQVDLADQQLQGDRKRMIAGPVNPNKYPVPSKLISVVEQLNRVTTSEVAS